MCDDEPKEHLMHLFFSCDFSQHFWMAIGLEWNTDYDIIEMLLEGKKRNQMKCFKECLIAGCWSFSKHRNGIIFNNKTKNMEYSMACFKEHFDTITKKAIPSLKEGMQSCLDYL